MASPEQLKQATDEVFRDPEVARTLAAWKAMHDRTGAWMAGRGTSPEEVAFRRAVEATGKLPEGSHIAWENGEPTIQNKGLPGWAYPLIIGGIAVTAGLATGAFGAGAGIASAAGGGGGASAATGGAGGAGVGIGEAGATTGLAGSGFGTGGGLGLTGVGAGSEAVAPILGSAATVPTAGALPAGGSTILGGTGGSSLAGASRFLTPNNILTGANIAGGALNAIAQNSRDKELNQIRRDALQLDRDKYALDAPEHRLDTSVHASRILNHTPVTAHWGGPGSGLRGETVKFTGGAANPNLIDQRTRDLSDDVINQQLQDQMQHADDLNPNDPEAVRRRRMAAPGSLPPSDVAIQRNY